MRDGDGGGVGKCSLEIVKKVFIPLLEEDYVSVLRREVFPWHETSPWLLNMVMRRVHFSLSCLPNLVPYHRDGPGLKRVGSPQEITSQKQIRFSLASYELQNSAHDEIGRRLSPEYARFVTLHVPTPFGVIGAVLTWSLILKL